MSKSTLSQLLAVHKDIKSKAVLTQVYQQLQKTALLNGQARTYQPLADDGEKFPSESQKVQVKVSEVLVTVQKALVELFNNTAALDIANTKAFADVVVDGQTLATQVPATYLLFLEKQLVDIKTLVSKLPVLDSAEDWTYNASQDVYATAGVQTSKTKKRTNFITVAPATEQHAAQVKETSEDVLVGNWNTIKYSGALPAKQVNEMLERVEKLVAAVKYAREKANSIAVEKQDVGGAILKFIFG
jgi:hypothetical protein